MKKIYLFAFFIFCFGIFPSFGQSLRLNNSGIFEYGDFEASVFSGSQALSLGSEESAPTFSILLDNKSLDTVIQRNDNLVDNKVEIKISINESYSLYFKLAAKDRGLDLSLYLTEPLPSQLKGRISLQMSLPAAYYNGAMCLIDGKPIILPDQIYEAKSFSIAPEDDRLRINLSSNKAIKTTYSKDAICLYSKLPSDAIGDVLNWHIEPAIHYKTKETPIMHWSRIGYFDFQKKLAIMTLPAGSAHSPHMNVYRINSDGYRQLVYQIAVSLWGKADQESNYLISNFSAVRESGIYCLEYDGFISDPFPISKDVLNAKWHSALKALNNSKLLKKVDASQLLSSLCQTWETFCPEEDFDNNNIPDFIDIIRTCTEDLLSDTSLNKETSREAAHKRIAALSASARVLKHYSPSIAYMAEAASLKLWDIVKASPSAARTESAVQLWLSSARDEYLRIITEGFNSAIMNYEGMMALLPAYPMLPLRLQNRYVSALSAQLANIRKEASSTPYGVPLISSDSLCAWLMDYFLLWRTFPGELEADAVLSGLSLIYGENNYADKAFLSKMDALQIVGFINASLASETLANSLK